MGSRWFVRRARWFCVTDLGKVLHAGGVLGCTMLVSNTVDVAVGSKGCSKDVQLAWSSTRRADEVAFKNTGVRKHPAQLEVSCTRALPW